jgi:beta-fructofuranosidase
VLSNNVRALQVVFEGLDPETMSYSLSAPTVRRVGGKLDPESFRTLALRIILDHSLLEVFTGTGQVITTRVYRGAPPTSDAGIDFLSFGGSAEVASLNAWEMSTIWQDPPVCSVIYIYISIYIWKNIIYTHIYVPVCMPEM